MATLAVTASAFTHTPYSFYATKDQGIGTVNLDKTDYGPANVNINPGFQPGDGFYFWMTDTGGNQISDTGVFDTPSASSDSFYRIQYYSGKEQLRSVNLDNKMDWVSDNPYDDVSGWVTP